jgi:hypothetical protein
MIGITLRLRNLTIIQVSELSYQVVQLDSLRAGLFAMPSKGKTPLLPGDAPLGPTVAPTNSAVRALCALHSIHAELGEELRIDDSDRRVARIDATVQADARMHELAGVLQGVPAIELHVQTVAQKRSALRPGIYANPDAVSATSGPPLLEKQLRDSFPSSASRKEFVGNVLSLSQAASARTWVLGQLSNHFTTMKCATLRAKERKDLDSLLLDETRSLDQDLLRLQEQVDPVLSVAQSTDQLPESDSAPGAVSEFSRGGPVDWQDQIRAMYTTLGKIDDNLSTLLVGADARNHSSEGLRADTRNLISGLHVSLLSFERRMSEPSH